MHDSGQKIADAAVPFSWAAWLVSHLKEVNEVLQTIALLAAIAASITAAIYHTRKTRQLGKQKGGRS